MTKKAPWLKCTKCGKVDNTEMLVVLHVGTKTTMRCEDCAGPDGRATLCRTCCPTGHGTHAATVDAILESWRKL